MPHTSSDDPHPQDSEANEAELACEKDRGQRFTQVFNENYRRVVYYFVRFGHSPEEARDMAQETFLRAFRSLDQFRGDSGIHSWIFDIARSVYLNALRDRMATKRKVELVSYDALEVLPSGEKVEFNLPADEQGPLEKIVVDEAQGILRDSLLKLPPSMRRVVVLYLREYSYSEIASLLGISIQTVKSQIHHAREKLKQLMNDADRPKKDDESKVVEVNVRSKLTEQEQKMIELYRKYQSMRKVAAEIGCSATWVSKTLSSIPAVELAAQGVEIRMPGYARNQTKLGVEKE